MSITSNDSIRRIYDKGERRHKHVGKNSKPEFKLDGNNPKKVIGLCPNNIPDEKRDSLLQKAIPLENDDSDIPVPKQLYAVCDGAIYELRTSDFGKTYHGYPFKGKLSGSMIDRIQKLADELYCRQEVDQWIKERIERHGK
jgi:hypothetical protein